MSDTEEPIDDPLALRFPESHMTNISEIQPRDQEFICSEIDIDKGTNFPFGNINKNIAGPIVMCKVSHKFIQNFEAKEPKKTSQIKCQIPPKKK